MYLQNNHDGISTYFGSYDFGPDDTIMFKNDVISGAYEKETSVKKNWDLFKDLGFKLDKVIEAPLAKKTKGSKESKKGSKKGSYEEKRMSVIEGAHESSDADYTFDIDVTGSYNDNDGHVIKDVAEELALDFMVFGANDSAPNDSALNDSSDIVESMTFGADEHDTMSFDFFGSHEESDDDFDPSAFMGSYDSDSEQEDSFDFY